MNDLRFITKKELKTRWGITTETLRVWLKENAACVKELEGTGYKKTQKWLSYHQFEIIRKYYE